MMTLFGVDILIDQDDKPWICEINGVRSGMRGFERIYGDNRVQEKVRSMLTQRYGEIRQYPLSPAPEDSSDVQLYLDEDVIAEQKFYLESLRNIPLTKKVDLFPAFEGTTPPAEKYVALHPFANPFNFSSVTSFAAETLVENKFLTYLVLKNHFPVPDSTLIGLGWSSFEDICRLITKSSKFIRKPLTGFGGYNVRTITTKTLLSALSHRACNTKDEFLEDVQPLPDYYDYYMHIVQEYIPTRKNGRYRSIRAIVCNEQFIDAYMRESPRVVANLTQDAAAKRCQYEVGTLAQNAACEILRQAETLGPSCRQQLYERYFSPLKYIRKMTKLSTISHWGSDGQNGFSFRPSRAG